MTIRFLTSLFFLVLSLTPHRARAFDVFLQEGFNTTGIPSGWVVSPVSGTSAIWSVVNVGTNPPIPPFAGSGQAKFNSFDAAPGDQARLTARRANFSAAVDPFLSFHIYHDDEWQSSLDSVYVDVTTGDSIAGPWTTLSGYKRPRQVTEWSREVVSLIQYVGVSRLFISFRGVSRYGNNVFLDEVRIADSSFHDIGARSLPAPSALGLEPFPAESSRFPLVNIQGTHHATMDLTPPVPVLNLMVEVQNYGTATETSYQVRWQVDGQNQAAVANAQPLSRDDRDTLLLSWPAPSPGTHIVTAWAFLALDSNHANDSARFTVVVLDSSVIFYELFNGVTFPPAGWSVVNRDGGTLPPWYVGGTTSNFLPFEGTGFAANNFQRANGTYIDDYLISPLIPGVAPPGRVDSLKFMVRSAFNTPPSPNYPDSLLVLLSTGGADTSDFNLFVDYFSVPKTGWTLKSYSLNGRVPPGSSVRIAFRYLHYNGGTSGLGSDFVGIDFVHVTRGFPTSIKVLDPFPAAFALRQNYPNPFNPSTEIVFSVGAREQTRLEVFNVLGQSVALLFDGIAHPEVNYWLSFNAANLASGLYLCQLRSGSNAAVRKMVLVR